MAEFDLAAMLKNVSKLDTGLKPEGREQIEYIALELIDSDPNNFYAMDGIEELAANIELLGLQQPLRVRPKPDQPGHVTIVSGHRRRAALEMLVQDGKTEFAQVPCIQEASAASSALQELRLIYANSDTRKMSSADLSRQAERVEALLYQLKEEGMEFPGRMRDHVAEACNLSRSKLARLKVIRENLDGGFVKLYEKNRLTVSTAYALAQQPKEIQRAVYDYKCTGKYGADCLREYDVKRVADLYQAITGQTCPEGGGQCNHGAALLGKIFDDSYSYKPCEYKRCCSDCEKLSSCKSACPKLADKAKRLKAAKKEAARQEKLSQERRERPDVEQITALWARFGEARRAARVSVERYMKAVKMVYGKSDDEQYKELETGCAKISPQTSLPYGYSFSLTDARRLVAAADCLGVSLDYLFCRTEAPEMKTGGDEPMAFWHTGNPRESGDYLVKLVLEDGGTVREVLDYDRYTSKWSWPMGEKLDEEAALVMGWIPLPEEDE